MSVPLIVGHRGAMGHAPENTVPSIEKAAELGADWVEFDVHRTADGILACHHDPWLNEDRGLLLSDLSFASALEQKPSLTRVGAMIEAAARCGLGANIELKEAGYEDELIALASQHLPAERLLFTSFHDSAVKRIKELQPSLRAGLLVGSSRLSEVDWGREVSRYTWLKHDLFPWRRLMVAQADLLVIPKRFRRFGMVERAGKLDYPVSVYTVNESKELELWAKTPNIEAIISNYPDRLATILA